MSKGIIYIDYDEALNIYGKMIDASDGGFEGVRDEGGIRATLDFVQNDLYYPTFADKLTYLMYRFCSGHFFNDGNKRIALLWVRTSYTKIITIGTLVSVCVHWNLSFITWQHRTSTKICCYASSIAF